jgi:hypothetical protein
MYDTSTGLCGAQRNYLTQYYQGQTSAGSATPVMVTVGPPRSGINASLEPGGTISGTVTDASTSANVAGVEVDVYDSSHSFVTEVCTGSDGSYSVSRSRRPGRSTAPSRTPSRLRRFQVLR